MTWHHRAPSQGPKLFGTARLATPTIVAKSDKGHLWRELEAQGAG